MMSKWTRRDLLPKFPQQGQWLWMSRARRLASACCSFGWRFKLGDADDGVKDFGYGALARERPYAKSGRITAAGLSFDYNGWQSVDLGGGTSLQ